ncbi:MAG: hypothetical protein ACR2K4_02685 [Candidatus Limnocylindria bacterium]
MFDYRLFFPSSTLGEGDAPRRPILGHPDKRVVRLPSGRREQRSRGRR